MVTFNIRKKVDVQTTFDFSPDLVTPKAALGKDTTCHELIVLGEGLRIQYLHTITNTRDHHYTKVVIPVFNRTWEERHPLYTPTDFSLSSWYLAMQYLQRRVCMYLGYKVKVANTRVSQVYWKMPSAYLYSESKRAIAKILTAEDF